MPVILIFLSHSAGKMFRSCDIAALPNQSYRVRPRLATLEKPRLDGAAWGRRSRIHVNSDWGDSDDVGGRACDSSTGIRRRRTPSNATGIIYRHSPFSVLGLIGGRR